MSAETKSPTRSLLDKRGLIAAAVICSVGTILFVLVKLIQPRSDDKSHSSSSSSTSSSSSSFSSPASTKKSTSPHHQPTTSPVATIQHHHPSPRNPSQPTQPIPQTPQGEVPQMLWAQTPTAQPKPVEEEEAHDCADCCHHNIDLDKELGKFVPGQAHYPSCPNDHPDRFQLRECGCQAKKQAHAERLQALVKKQQLVPVASNRPTVLLPPATPRARLQIPVTPRGAGYGGFPATPRGPQTPHSPGFPPTPRGLAVPMTRSPSSSSDKWVVGKTQSLESLYELGALIGEGQFGKAYTAINKQTKEEYAVKMISKQQFWDERESRYIFGELRDEIAILKQLNHPNIIKCFDILETSGYLYLIMECCKGGELFDRIQQQTHYSEKDAVGVLRQIAEALKYLHHLKIAHCDLKPDNCLFFDSSPDSRLKIIDFGMSKHIQRRRYLSLMRGTPFYVAPEVLQGKYAEHCDIWSFGVVMFVMLFGYPPFYAKTEDEIYAKIEAGFQNVTKPGYGPWFPANIPCSADAKDLIVKCLNSNHATRLSADEILEHKFMNGGASVLPFEPMVGSNLSDFRANTQLRVRVLSLMSGLLDQNELGALKKIFKEIDANGDGVITKEELKQAFRKQGVVADTQLLRQVEEVMRTSDLDGDGTLSYEELVMTAVQRKLHAKEERLWEAFCRFDKDHDGSISAAEVAEVLKVSEREADALIREIDKNGDGVVDYDEFRAMMMAKEEEGVSMAINVHSHGSDFIS